MTHGAQLQVRGTQATLSVPVLGNRGGLLGTDRFTQPGPRPPQFMIPDGYKSMTIWTRHRALGKHRKEYLNAFLRGFLRGKCGMSNVQRVITGHRSFDQESWVRKVKRLFLLNTGCSGSSQHQHLHPDLTSPGPFHLITQGSWPQSHL